MSYLKYLSVLSISLLCSCSSYTIPVDSFTDQFEGIGRDTMKLVSVRNPMGVRHNDWANPLDSITCLDKNNNIKKLKNKPSLELRITDIKNKKTVFYFDTVYLTDSTVVGSQSRFIPLDKSIRISDIVKIEIQDGRKKFSY